MMRCRIALVLVLVIVSSSMAAAPPDRLELAIRRGLRRLEEGASNYIQNRQCFSCHHQTLTIAALQRAKRLGFWVRPGIIEAQTTFTRESFEQRLEQVRKGQTVGGISTTVVYALHTLQLAGHSADATTTALVDYLLVRQEKDGSWPAQMQRVPSEGSKFTNAALALSALHHYGHRDKTKSPAVDEAFKKGKAWLLRTQPQVTEDQVFRLRGLIEVRADRDEIEEARRLLMEQQLSDGSWSQIPSRDGDAYATATVLVALRQSGVPTTNPNYRSGIEYLLRTQTAEGAWIVSTRVRPVQRWFDNGDPGGKNQFISFLSTGWSTLALIESINTQ